MKKISMVAATVIGTLLTGWQAASAEENSPVVLELYTSQSCSSCPPADRLLQDISHRDPSLIALSFHVDYWDYLQWKDPFSSPENTARQRAYSAALGRANVYTPQLVVDGRREMVGSDAAAVQAAIAAAKRTAKPVAVAITPQAGQYQVTVNAQDAAALPKADIWLARVVKHATTTVPRGENAGSTIENINNVTQLTRLRPWTPGTSLTLPVSQTAEDGIAIIVQAADQGPVLGAAIAMRAQ